jgi:hypothetical protein
MKLKTVRKGFGIAAMAATAILGAAGTAPAGVIVGAVSGVVEFGGPGDGSLDETINQAGLSSGYTSGVTDFDAYLATHPTHTWVFDGFEWFSESGTTLASVTYDLGAVYTVGHVALWNEESAGIGLLDLYGSTDGISFLPLALGVAPTDNPLDFADYAADVFSFAASDLRYVRFDMFACPQPDPGAFAGCAIGEVAFGTAERIVPEPASLSLLGLGLGVAALRRRNR